MRKRIVAALLAAMVLLTSCSGNITEPEIEKNTEDVSEIERSAEKEPEIEKNTEDVTENERGAEKESEIEKNAEKESEIEKNAEKEKHEVKAIEAVLPDPVAKDTAVDTFLLGDEHWEWWQEYREKVDASITQQDGMDRYYAGLQKEILADGNGGNAVCSPLNIYMALSMLAEVTDGNTRQQILDVLEAEDMESLRKRVKALWDVNYVDTPLIKSLLADSMWLRNDISYHEDALRKLAEEYHASSYSGEMGSEELNEQLRKWTDEHTGGILTEYTKDLEFQPETVLALVSAIYYKASWNDKFQQDRTEDGIFHGLSGDQVVSMMHQDGIMGLYETENFQAVGLGLSDSGIMYFFLPKEGCIASDIVADPDLIRICMDPSAIESTYPLVHLSVPKFDVGGKTDLLRHLNALGITDAASPEEADFSPLTDEVERIWLNGAEHAARVSIDEEGVTGAAYTDLMMSGAGMPQDEVNFVLDRPFVFTVAAPDGSILFSGIVQVIE